MRFNNKPSETREYVKNKKKLHCSMNVKSLLHCLTVLDFRVKYTDGKIFSLLNNKSQNNGFY